jgi:hypothetical protein
VPEAEWGFLGLGKLLEVGRTAWVQELSGEGGAVHDEESCLGREESIGVGDLLGAGETAWDRKGSSEREGYLEREELLVEGINRQQHYFETGRSESFRLYLFYLLSRTDIVAAGLWGNQVRLYSRCSLARARSRPDGRSASSLVRGHPDEPFPTEDPKGSKSNHKMDRELFQCDLQIIDICGPARCGAGTGKHQPLSTKIAA